MSIIKQLDDFTINQIAAGEVIERPSSVVKELIENSIDADSTAITVEIKDGGISYIRVTDNGKGMDREDALLSFERHATSKISDAKDLDRISTLGFRGEALASIAAVSQMEMYTRRPSAIAGYHITNHGGTIIDNKEAGCPEGTSIIVRNLFYNAPARLKFLKTNRSESAAISELISKIILAHPEIAIKFINNDSLIYRSSGDSSLKNAILSVYGHDTKDQLMYIRKENDSLGLKLHGFLGKPSLSRTNRKHQSFFVNGRYIKSKILSQSLEDATSEVTMINHFPWAVLNIEIPPIDIDVNVHPSKTEIRFNNEKEIYSTIYKWIRETIEDHPVIPNLIASEMIDKVACINKNEEILDSKATQSSNIKQEKNHYIREELVIDRVESQDPDIKTEPLPIQIDLIDDIASIDNELNDNTKVNYDFMRMRIIGRVFNTYILVELDNDLYIIDQHAAHERLLYERINNSINKQEIVIQQLSPPFVLELTHAEYTLVTSNLQNFTNMGFIIEPFGQSTFIIRGLPVLIKDINIRQLFNRVLDSLYEENRKVNSNHIEKETIIKMACRQAVKANDKLDDNEILGLLRDLSLNKIPLTCPHGRPIMTTISQSELEKKFKRIQ